MRRLGFICVLVTTVSVLLVSPVVLPRIAAADTLQQRSLFLSNTAPSASSDEVFNFTYQTAAVIGSVSFEYCDSPLEQVPCVAPGGMDASAATLQDQSGVTGFSMESASANKLIIGRVPAAIAGHWAASYSFGSVVNPSGAPHSFYVRINTYSSSDGSGASIDYGAVVNSTTQSVQISTEVPPILNFCVGQSIPTDCSSADGDVVDLGVLRSSSAATGTSQFLVGTNAQFGLAVTAAGTTMTSGNNVIPALASPTPSAPGTAQFGLNLRANTSPPIGADPTGPGVASPSSQYNIVNRFVFHPNDVIVASSGTTDTRKFTVSYLANVPASQPPGVYTATLTYICTASF